MEWDFLVAGFGSRWAVKSEQRRVLSADELRKRRARHIFYVRISRWAFLALFVGAIVVSAILLWNGGDKYQNGLPKAILASRKLVQQPPSPPYDFSVIVSLMEEYSELVSDEDLSLPGRERPVPRMKDLLGRLHEQREVYYEYLERDRKLQGHAFQTRRAKRASLHYLRSMENAIANLQRIIERAEAGS